MFSLSKPYSPIIPILLLLFSHSVQASSEESMSYSEERSRDSGLSKRVEVSMGSHSIELAVQKPKITTRKTRQKRITSLSMPIEEEDDIESTLYDNLQKTKKRRKRKRKKRIKKPKAVQAERLYTLEQAKKAIAKQRIQEAHRNTNYYKQYGLTCLTFGLYSTPYVWKENLFPGYRDISFSQINKENLQNIRASTCGYWSCNVRECEENTKEYLSNGSTYSCWLMLILTTISLATMTNVFNVYEAPNLDICKNSRVTNTTESGLVNVNKVELFVPSQEYTDNVSKIINEYVNHTNQAYLDGFIYYPEDWDAPYNCQTVTTTVNVTPGTCTGDTHIKKCKYGSYLGKSKLNCRKISIPCTPGPDLINTETIVTDNSAYVASLSGLSASDGEHSLNSTTRSASGSVIINGTSTAITQEKARKELRWLSNTANYINAAYSIYVIIGIFYSTPMKVDGLAVQKCMFYSIWSIPQQIFVVGGLLIVVLFKYANFNLFKALYISSFLPYLKKLAFNLCSIEISSYVTALAYGLDICNTLYQARLNGLLAVDQYTYWSAVELSYNCSSPTSTVTYAGLFLPLAEETAQVRALLNSTAFDCQITPYIDYINDGFSYSLDGFKLGFFFSIIFPTILTCYSVSLCECISPLSSYNGRYTSSIGFCEDEDGKHRLTHARSFFRWKAVPNLIFGTSFVVFIASNLYG